MLTLSRRRLLLSLAASPLAAAPTVARAGDGPILLRDLYEKDRSFSALATGLEGRRISVEGFMAPPLRAESSFFVLTRRPMAVCPFCNDAADWPADIVAIYTKRQVRVIAFNIPIAVDGRLELGTYKDPDLGFVSRVRLVDAVYDRI
ncbi:hypothetical protein SAMN05421538_101132 [Paracoccus isoporae]|uniref:DUF3299 domain-containing protein n=1 Tax=Paracoccus isoporae TaxID=591205 RepID=A0A1G6SYU0_9RHOB|nr:hypothetical protein [Paracoccus isoporae]SDD21881.1 hypothetical protein SAMN05421538_101132 [Paracoccus isoporae]